MLAKAPALANLGGDQPLVWEELPKSRALTCLADSNVRWREVPRVRTGTGWRSSDVSQPSRPSLQIAAAKEDGGTRLVRLQAWPTQATCPGFPAVLGDGGERWIFGQEPLLCGSSPNSLDGNLPGPVCPASPCPELPASRALASSSTGVVHPKASSPAGSLVAGLTCCHHSGAWTGDRSSTWAFPSLPQPSRQPRPVSAIPGLPSAGGCSQAGWATAVGPLTLSRAKTAECRVSSSPPGCQHPGSAWALAPSCPRWSRTPGFPSVPRYSMLTLLPVWPKASAVPGCGSEGYRGPSKRLWRCQPRALLDRLTKAAPFMTYGPARGGASLENMFRLTPCCPEACRTPGFPSCPQGASKVGFAAVRVVHCCSAASRTEGLGLAAPGTGWVELAKPLLTSPQLKEAETLAPFAGRWGPQQQGRGNSMKSTATSCPTESRVHGCPSAPPVDPPANMLSLHAPAACSPCILGIPSSRTLTAEWEPKQPGVKAVLPRPETDTRTFSAEPLVSTLPPEVEVAAMAPSCPRVAAGGGFPSASHPWKLSVELDGDGG